MQVCLKSIEAKNQFLQVRRIKKDIYPADIGISQQSKRPLLITEQLTRHNQELLFKARSIRGPGGFKFVWSKNGQILARHKENSRVIRITDQNQITQIKEQIDLVTRDNGQ